MKKTHVRCVDTASLSHQTVMFLPGASFVTKNYATKKEGYVYLNFCSTLKFLLDPQISARFYSYRYPLPLLHTRTCAHLCIIELVLASLALSGPCGKLNASFRHRGYTGLITKLPLVQHEDSGETAQHGGKLVSSPADSTAPADKIFILPAGPA